MKILILSIYSDDTPYYKKMLEIQRKYVHNYENVDYYFLQSNFEHNEPVFIENDMIFVREKENHFTILNKSLQAIDTLFNLWGKYYDFIIRTNISTVIHIPKMLELLAPYKYDLVHTDLKLKLEYLYAGDLCGIYIDNIKKGIKFALGTAIIISKQLAKQMISRMNDFNHSLPDDVAFGLFVQEYNPNAFDNDLKLTSHVFYTHTLNNGWNSTVSDFIYYMIQKYNKNPPFIFYRNKTNNREEDVNIMNYICNNII
jgi:hypothetical protein